MRQTDAAAIKGIGIPGVVLMERAGIAVAEYLLDHYCQHHCFVVLAGKGNNGGDGFVAARHLMEAGADVRVLCAAPAGEYSGDALVNLKILKKLGLKVDHAPADAVLRRALAGDCIIVDAVFGTGFAGEPRGRAQAFIGIAAAAADRNCLPVVAVDIASGVDASTGEAAATSLPADATVTFHAPKVGHFAAPGGYLCGDLILADIGIPEEAGAAADHYLIDPEVVAATIPPKMEYDNKFSVGRVLVVGGSTGLTGAPCMTAMSAIRAGAGVVTAAVPEGLNAIFEQKLTEVMTLPLDGAGSGRLTEAALPALLKAAASFDCLAIGPGLGRHNGTMRLVRKLLEESSAPVVLDADGLFALAGRPGTLKKRRAATVLTPHAGELGRLLDLPSAEVAESSLACAVKAARRSSAIVVLKGAYSITTDGSKTLINSSGNPGLATAGSGDVLTGLIAALVARGLPPLDAAAGGVYIHGSTADLAAGDLGMDNIVSTDLIDYLPQVFAELDSD
jgi:hydroxyethylthiazole kinase-like uncharacterized protein yjeF